MRNEKVTVLSTWIYRLLVLILWGLLGLLFVPHLQGGDGAVLAAGVLGALLLTVAVGVVRLVWTVLAITPPWEAT